MSPAIFTPWRGYRPIFNYGLSGVPPATSSAAPQFAGKDIADNVYVMQGSHQLSFGGEFTQVNSWQQIASNDT